MIVRHKYTRTGPTPDDVLKEVQQRYIDALVSDLKATPEQFEGTPYKETGELQRGIAFKPASATGRKSGLLGKIVAPDTRFASKWIAKGFVRLFGQLWDVRGQGWSRPDLKGKK